MDTLGGLAFAGEPALEYYMKEMPKRRDESILTRAMLGRVAIMGAYTLGLCIAFLKLDFFKLMFFGGSEIHFLTAFYALFIFLGIFNCFSARCERMWILSNISKNRPFVIIMILISAIQILMIFFGGTLFRTTPISFAEIGKVVLLAFTLIPFDGICRIFKRLSPNRE